jgi:hypothetical protein
MAVCANEIWDLRLWLSCGGAEESKLKERKGEGGTKPKRCYIGREKEGPTITTTTTTIIPIKDLVSITCT